MYLSAANVYEPGNNKHNNIIIPWESMIDVDKFRLLTQPSIIPAKPLHNSDTVSVHFNDFYCMGICDKLSRHLSMLTYIYLNVDEC